jgi:hypothetical protein
MSIRTEWLVKSHVILTQGVGDISEADLVHFLESTNRMLADEMSHPIHLIQDWRYVGKPYSDLKKVRELLVLSRSISGWYLVINKKQNPYFAMLAAISAQLIGIKTRPPFLTYEAAREFLLEHEPELPLPDNMPDDFLP